MEVLNVILSLLEGEFFLFKSKGPWIKLVVCCTGWEATQIQAQIQLICDLTWQY